MADLLGLPYSLLNSLSSPGTQTGGLFSGLLSKPFLMKSKQTNPPTPAQLSSLETKESHVKLGTKGGPHLTGVGLANKHVVEKYLGALQVVGIVELECSGFCPPLGTQQALCTWEGGREGFREGVTG